VSEPSRLLKNAESVVDLPLRQAQGEVKSLITFALMLSLSKHEGERTGFSAAC